MAIDLAKMRAKLDSVKNKGGKTGFWKPPEGESTIRIVPTKDGDPFKDYWFHYNLGNNTVKKNTTFIAIQQVTKGGVFVGSNKLKHNTTGMLELRLDQESGSSYMVFAKNRRGSVGKRMFYSLSASGDVEYDLKRFSNDEDARVALNHERTPVSYTHLTLPTNREV